MERKEELAELAEMKRELKLLRERLDKENIISRNHIKKGMQKNISHLSRYGRMEVVLGVFALINFQFIFSHFGFSAAFMTVTSLGLLGAVIASIIYHRNIFKLNTGMLDLLSMAYELSRLKQRYATWRRYAIPCMIVWIGWMCYECYMMNNEIAMSLATGCLVGAVIGGVIGTRLYYRQVSRIDEVLQNIEELRKTEEK